MTVLPFIGKISTTVQSQPGEQKNNVGAREYKKEEEVTFFFIAPKLRGQKNHQQPMSAKQSSAAAIHRLEIVC